MATNPPTLRLGLARALRSASSTKATTTRLFTTSHAPPQPRHRPTTSITPVNPQRKNLHTTSPIPRRSNTNNKNQQVPSHPPKTDFAELDVLANTPTPSTAVDVCFADGFALNSGVRITGGDGALLVGGEAFRWRPWEAAAKHGNGRRLVNARGQWELGEEGFAVLGVLWPRPGEFCLLLFLSFLWGYLSCLWRDGWLILWGLDLLILGLGPEIRPLSPATRRAIGNLGMRVEVLDTRNAASQYNLLATERGVEDVAAALIPIGWKEGA